MLTETGRGKMPGKVSLARGTRLGSYVIEDSIGSGGMGEVYRALDTTLQRVVALKVLPDHLVADPERVARFEREATTLALINHPNVAQIYGLAHDDTGRGALVMEFVDGEDLGHLIRRAPGMDRVLDVARQVAAGLEAAHDLGVIHRDLKPANIKVRVDGTVKVLDFGIARVAQVSGPPFDSASTVLPPTAAGTIVGTPAYMSPEQATGRRVDRRSDLWSFGCVLFEMLAGDRLFTGATTAEITSAVLRDAPDWTRLPPSTPAPIRKLLRRCLERDPARRLDSAAVARLEIDEAIDGADGGPDAQPVRHPGRGLLIAAMVVAVISSALAVVLWQRADATPEVHLDITTPIAANPYSFAVSPDGARLVFVAGGYDTPLQLFLRSFADSTPRPLAGTEGAVYPFWAPDGESIGFFANGRLRRVDLAGGSVRVLANAGAGRGGSWSINGQILFTQNASGPISIVSAEGGESRVLTVLEPGDASHLNPVWHPDGRRFFYFKQSGSPEVRGVYVATIDQPAVATRLLSADGGAQFRQPGYLVFVRDATLYLQKFDDTTSTVAGDPIAVTGPVPSTFGRSAFSVSNTGPLAYRSGTIRGSQLRWFNRQGEPGDAFGEPDLANPLGPMLAPSSRRVAIRRTVLGNEEVWLLDESGGAPTRLTMDPAPDIFPVWAPDESAIAFRSNRGDTLDIYVTSVAGTSPPALLLKASDVDPTANSASPTDWSSDGRFLLFYTTSNQTSRNLWALPMGASSGRPRLLLGSRFDETNARFSPDGRWLLYQTNETGRFEIAVRAFQGDERVWQISSGGGVHGRWSRDGKELFYLAPDGRLMAVAVDGSGSSFRAGAPVALFAPRFAETPGANPFLAQYDVAADGRFLVNLTLDDIATAPISLILNWKGAR